ncbi:MAG: efflux RND transporter periplasmic adaptor subunit [Labilithrix sp.]
MPEGEEPPPRGVRTMALVRWALLLFFFATSIFMWIAYAHERTGTAANGTRAEGPRYHCPMHPQVVSNEPGECPICHMDLVAIAVEDAGASSAMPETAGAKPLVVLDDSGAPAFWCPMDTEVRSAKPGRCPLCKMALEPMPQDAGVPGHARHLETDAGPGSVPAGTTPILLTLDRIQSIGVRTALVEETTSGSTLRVTAVVQEPEQGAAEVHVRTPGFVEAIRVDQTGIEVRAGQELFTLYSPEILQAENELLTTRSWTGDAGSLATGARTKLELLGMTASDIDRVIASRQVLRAVSVVAPRGGFVAKKNVVLGSYVTPEMTLYAIQDLSRVYVVAEVFLRDLEHVRAGTSARFVPSGHPSDAVSANIDLVYPVVSAEARTRRIRMQLANAGGRQYAPGEFGIVEVATPARRAVTIPRDALIDTGGASYVFVVEGEGRFVPRIVATSGTNGDRLVLDAGLVAGERVVSGATFLIDSESRLQASIAEASGNAKATK